MLSQILKASKAPLGYVSAVKTHRCESCEKHKNLPQTHKTSLPKPYVFNEELGFDVLEVYDSSGTRYSILNILD